MCKRLPRNRHPQLARISEVRQGHASWLECLAKDHVALRSVQGAPVADTPFQSAAHAVVRKSVWIAQLQVPQQGHSLDGGIALEDRQEHRFPNCFERVGHRSASGGLALGRKARISLDTTGSAFAEPRAGGSDTLGVM
jgi:hypothetical protein